MSEPLPVGDLIQRYFDGVAEAADLDELQRQLTAHAEVADAFVEAAWFESLLQTALVSGMRVTDLELSIASSLGPVLRHSRQVRNESDAPAQLAEAEEYGLPPVPGFGVVGGLVRGITQIGVLPYLAFATVTLVLCFAVQLVWEWRLSDGRPMASQIPAAIRFAEDRVLTGVGHVSGMDACRWGEGSERPGFYDRVAIGQKFHLEAGLLEITYDTGFKAILQGPVRYEVTSSNGGFLSVGKLTGNATTERARGFTVDMPTARVTDLGTEFAAEVAANGTVETVVFTGEVRLTPAAPPGEQAAGQVLRKGEAAQVVRDPEAPNPIVELVANALGDRFTRTMPPTPVQVLIGPGKHNGSFEEPVVGPNNCDPEASDPATKVYAKTRGVTPRFWNPTFALQTTGTVVRGATGQQHVVLQGTSFVVFSTRLDGSGGHPPMCTYAPQTIYVLTADLGAKVGGMKAHVGFDDGSQAVRQAVTVSAPNVLEPIPPLVLNTDLHREFVGKPIGVSFMKTGSASQSPLYLDNVVLRAFPSSP